jgi:hypothetical protein
MTGNDALPFVQVGAIAFGPSHASKISTKVTAGNYYMLKITIQARALNALDNGKLLLEAYLKPTSLDSKVLEVMTVPSERADSKGQIIQTLQVTGILYAGANSESINLSLLESKNKKIASPVGLVELTKINYQPVITKSTSNVAAVARTAAAVAAKAKAAAEAAAAKAKAAAIAAAAKAKAAAAAKAKAKAAVKKP